MNRAIDSETKPLLAEIQRLQLQVGLAQTVIDELHAGSAAEKKGTERRARELVTVNEVLVVTALRAQTDADTATRAFNLLARSSELDSLTELPNRQTLMSRFRYAISIARRTSTQLALLFVDLNDFKQINDSLGHGVGDQVLRLAARRLATAVRESDTVSRHGGDEFLILLTDVALAGDIVQIATKLITALGRPARVGDHVLRLTASIGISLYPQDSEDTEMLIKLADAAMYQAKRAGGGGYAFHSNEALIDSQGKVPALPPVHHPLSHYRAALAEQAHRHAVLRSANEQLVLSVLNAQALRDAAELARRRQTEFIAVIAHELRNPLVPMQNAAALLHRARVDEALLPRVQTMIERQVAHLSRLVGDLLDVSRVTTGKLRIAREALDLAEVIDQSITACRPTMESKLQHFSAEIPEGPLEFFGDPVRLAQIFNNLLDNATKYTPVGGEISLLLVWGDDSCIATVTDSGLGISPSVITTIFEPFAQDPTAVEFNGTGLGLGLTVAHDLIAAHGGSITAGSAGPGLGSRFTVTLPRHPVLADDASAALR